MTAIARAVILDRARLGFGTRVFAIRDALTPVRSVPNGHDGFAINGAMLVEMGENGFDQLAGNGQPVTGVEFTGILR
jgi:hypothetical protein